MPVKSVNDLLDKPFKCFSGEEQLQIVKKGRFTDLDNITYVVNGKQRCFMTNWYHKVKWLTGNTVNKRLYCWNCVLFPTNSNSGKVWTKTGFTDLRNLSQAVKKHHETREHIYATIKLKLIYKNMEKRVDTTLKKSSEVKRNREYLERLIDIASILAQSEVPFRRGPSDEGPYKSLVNLCAKYDDITRVQLEQRNNFHGLTKLTQIGLIQAMKEVVLNRITEEVYAATCFSIIVNEVNSDLDVKNISISLRYALNGEPVERCIGFFPISHDSKANEVVNLLDKELEKFNYKNKMIAQSYDGNVVKASELYNLQQAMKNKQNMLCQAPLVYYYEHDIMVLLSQSLNSIPECRKFFSVITLLCNLVQNWNVPLDKASFSSISSCIVSIKSQYDSLVRFLEFVTIDETYLITPSIISDSINLLYNLKNFKFMVLIYLFDKLVVVVERTLNRIKEDDPDAFSCRNRISELINTIKVFKGTGEFNSFVGANPVGMQGTALDLAELFTLAERIIDSLVHEIEGRFLDIEMSDFIGLIDLKHLNAPTGATKRPDWTLLLNIKENLPTFFENNKLSNELELLYSDPTIGGFHMHEVNRRRKILKFFHDNDLKENIPELYKFLELIVAIPSFSEPLEGRRCVLNRLNSLRNRDKKEEPVSDLALLAVERDLLIKLKESDQWYQQVINEFVKLPIGSSVELGSGGKDEEKPCKSELTTNAISEPDLDIKEEVDDEDF